MLKDLEKLCQLPGVSGREDAVRDYILNSIKNLADELVLDNSGSVIAMKRGKRRPKKRLLISAHMDEVGLIVTRICDDGLLKFAAVGGIDARVLCGKAVLVGDSLIPGVIGVVPVHISSQEDKGRAPKMDTLTIDIGASSRAQAEDAVSPGDVCVFDTGFELFGEDLIKAKALDDRAGCAVLLELMRQDYECDVYFSFVTMEEVGLRGAACAAYTVSPDMAIVVEATTAADIPGVDEDSQVCRIGGGAVISFMDKNTIYDRDMFQKALELGEEKGIAVQVKESVAGGNDAGAIHQSRTGVRTLAVSLPCRYLHAPVSVISKEDLTATYETVYELIREFNV